MVFTNIANLGGRKNQSPTDKFLNYEGVEQTPQQKCEAKGGRWDEQLQKCIMNVKEQVAANQEKKKLTEEVKEPEAIFTQTKPELFTDAKTGAPSGIITPSGNTYLGGSPDDLRAAAVQEQAKTALPPGIETAGTAQQQFRQAIAQQRLLSQMGQVGGMQLPMGEAPINWSQALTAGTITNLPSILKSAGTGAAGGALAAGPIGAVAGGVGGLITSIWGGVQRDIKKQQTGEIGASKDVLSNAKTNMMKLSRLASMDPGNAEYYVETYNQWLGEVHKARRQIKLETQGDLNAFMEDGRDILSDFDLFLGPGGQAEIYKYRIMAQLNQEATPEEMMLWALEEQNE